MKQKLLLVEDVNGLGRSGDIVSVKSGYSRNFLLPQKLAIIAHKNTLNMQKRLKEEREKQAALDKKESEEVVQKFKDVTLTIEVKVDPDGHLYGSVSPQDITELFKKEGYSIDKKWVRLQRPIKELGSHVVPLVLKEGVQTSVALDVLPEGGKLPEKKSKETPEEIREEKKEEMKEAEENAEDAKE